MDSVFWNLLAGIEQASKGEGSTGPEEPAGFNAVGLRGCHTRSQHFTEQ